MHRKKIVAKLACLIILFSGLALCECSSAEMLNVGTPAPDFTLKNQDGNDVTLSQELKKGHVVLYFYPKDNTPGCTKEACSFRDLSEEFLLAGASIFGVNTDSVESHKKFHEKNKLTFSLLADPESRVTTLYGAIVSNAIFLPFAEKLGFINKQELLSMEIVIRGIMAIQSGENPRVIEQKLGTFLPPNQRQTEKEAA